jgi:hypothetical protein
MKVTELLIILQGLSDGADINAGNPMGELIRGFKTLAAPIIGVGFILAGIGVVKRLANDHADGKKSLIAWIVALIVFIAIWSLV